MKLAIITLLCIGIQLASAVKFRLREEYIYGSITSEPTNGAMVIFRNYKYGKCLDMDSDTGIHFKTCKNEDDEKWYLVQTGDMYRLKSVLNNRFFKIVGSSISSTATESDGTAFKIVSQPQWDQPTVLLTFYESSLYRQLYGKKKGNGKYKLKVTEYNVNQFYSWLMYQQ